MYKAPSVLDELEGEDWHKVFAIDKSERCEWESKRKYFTKELQVAIGKQEALRKAELEKRRNETARRKRGKETPTTDEGEDEEEDGAYLQFRQLLRGTLILTWNRTQAEEISKGQRPRPPFASSQNSRGPQTTPTTSAAWLHPRVGALAREEGQVPVFLPQRPASSFFLGQEHN